MAERYIAVLWACLSTKSESLGCWGFMYLEPGEEPRACSVCGMPMIRVGDFELEAA
jgi:hypothetical protein